MANVQRIIVAVVLVMLVVLLAVMIVRLGWLLAVELFGTPLSELSVDQLLHLFGFVLLVLIGVELVESVQLFLTDAHVHVEFVILIALIAISRKIIILDLAKHLGGDAAGYRRARRRARRRLLPDQGPPAGGPE